MNSKTSRVICVSCPKQLESIIMVQMDHDLELKLKSTEKRAELSKVNRLIVCFTIGIFSTIGLSPSDNFILSGRTVTIEITHSHEHDDHVHSHDGHLEESGSQTATKSTKPHSDSHKHVITLSTNTALNVPRSPILKFAIVDDDSTVHGGVVTPPADRSLDTLFRPPIYS